MEFDPHEKPATGAVSLYGEAAGIDDFPVLKAFQQYIDAEQSKARKRLAWICSIFAILTILIVLAFAAVIAAMSSKFDERGLELNRRNQELNDRLIEYAMKECERASAKSTAKDDSTDKLVSALTALQQQVASQQRAPAAVGLATDPSATRERARLEAERMQLERQRLENAEKVKRAHALLAEEREKLRQQEVELQRRRLYPDYYRAKDEVERENAAASADTSHYYSRPWLPASTSTVGGYKTNADGTINYFDTAEESPLPANGNSNSGPAQDVLDEIIRTPASWAIPD